MSDTKVHQDTSFESFIEELGLHEEVYGEAIKRVIAWQLENERVSKGVTKASMAEAMGTSRTQLSRVLDPTNVNVSVESLDRAARAVGKKLVLELVDA